MPPRKRKTAKPGRAAPKPSALQLDVPLEVLGMICEHLLDDEGESDALCQARLVNRRWCRVASSVSHRRVVIRGLLHIKQFLAAILADTRRARGTAQTTAAAEPRIATTTFYAPDIHTLILVEPKSIREWEKNRARMVAGVLNSLRTALPRLVGMRRLVLDMFVWPTRDIQVALSKCPALRSLEIRQVREVRPVVDAVLADGTYTTIANPFDTKDHFPTDKHRSPDMVLSLTGLERLHIHVPAQGIWSDCSTVVAQFCRHYLCEMTALQSLAINFSSKATYADGLSYYQVLRHTWSSLRRVALVGLHIDDMGMLWQFLARHPKLEHFDWREPTMQPRVSFPRNALPPATLKLPNLRSLFFLPRHPNLQHHQATLAILLRATERPIERLLTNSAMISAQAVDALLADRHGGVSQIADIWLDLSEDFNEDIRRLLQASPGLRRLELSFSSMRLPLDVELVEVLQSLSPACRLEQVSITASFSDSIFPPVDGVEELLIACARLCSTLRRLDICWIRHTNHPSFGTTYGFPGDPSYSTWTFFARRSTTWEGIEDGTGSDEIPVVLRGRVDTEERQEPLEWDDARPGCPAFSKIPSFY